MGDERTPGRPPRRPRYRGKNPRHFTEKYKEHDPERYPDAIGKVLASGKTPAGSHRPIMVPEILEILTPQPGEIAVDATLGHGGHACEILPRLLPGGRLLGLDVDPIELPKTETRLRALGFGPDVLSFYRSNFAGLPQALRHVGFDAADIILADLGVSSMQIDDPDRGFSVKQEGPLDMRMNPQRGQPVSALIAGVAPVALAQMLTDHADEPHALVIAHAIARKDFPTTTSLTLAIRGAIPRVGKDDVDLSVRRTFQALRIEVNDEFSALEMFLRNLPGCLKPRGRVAILSFHSGEDRRVKKAFQEGVRTGIYASIATDVIRASAAEQRANPRSTSAKLRWAIRA